MIIECIIRESEHKVVHSIGPYSGEEADKWYDELYEVWTNEYAKIINRLRNAYQYNDLFMFSLVSFEDTLSRSALYKRNKYFSVHYKDKVFKILKRTEQEWYYYQAIPKGADIPNSFYNCGLPLYFENTSSPLGYMKSILVLTNESEIDDSCADSVLKFIKGNSGYSLQSNYIAITYFSVGCDGNSIAVHYGRHWPPV